MNADLYRRLREPMSLRRFSYAQPFQFDGLDGALHVLWQLPDQASDVLVV